MDQPLEVTVRRIGYARARLLLLAVGLVVLLLISAVMLARGVDRAEVAGNLLFIPVFAAFVLWGVKGGVIGGIAAIAGYVALRYPAIRTVGIDRFSGPIIFRATAFLLFGALGGWANRQLEASLTKLELYDQIDDPTGLYNARFFVQYTDLEMSRSKRYRTIFSLAVVDIPASWFEPLSRRQRAGILRELGRILRDSVRTVDRAVHGRDSARHRLAVLLPETGREGAQVFTERLRDSLVDFLARRGIAVSREQAGARAATFPDEEESIATLRAEFAEIDRAEHPEEAQPARSGRGEGERR